MAQTGSQKQRIPVIIDTDPGVDDILAILLALASPELDVKAIIITFGNTDVEAAHLNILRLSQVLSRTFEADKDSERRFPNFSTERKIILARGADHPLEGDLHSAQYFHGRDGLSNISERYQDFGVDPSKLELHPNLDFSAKSGVDVALDILNSEPERSITYIALGPLTTLAQLARSHGDVLRTRIGQIACMGGALDVPGNSSPVAEFNFFADPYAVHELLNSPTAIPLERFMLIPLDITTPHELPFPFYNQHIDPHFIDTRHPSIQTLKSPLVHFTSAFLERTREVMVSFGKDAMELHDIVVVWFATQNPPSPPSESREKKGFTYPLKENWNAVPRHFQVERIGEITRGMLVVDRRESEGDTQGAYDPGVNRAAVQAELAKHVFHPQGIMESNAIPAQVEIEAPPPSPPKGKESPDHPGVPVLVKTPGPEALLRLMTERVWGVSVP
ncbi:nucleoside hydrolase [Cytidiella melzeri]|nr:nucleoside hydrolase [Cytidiella melzeri]